MKKSVLILGTLILFSSSAYACPGETSKHAEFHHKKIKFSATKALSKSDIKSASIFSVKGMHCNNCVKKVETAISSITGVKMVKVDLKGAKASVVFKSNSDKKSISDKITKALEKSGFKANRV